MKKLLFILLSTISTSQASITETVNIAISTSQVNIDILSVNSHYSKIVISENNCIVSFKVKNSQLDKLYGVAMDQMLQIFMKKCGNF